MQHVAASVTTVSTPGHVTDQERGWAQGTGLLSPADDFSSLHSPGLGVMLDGDSTSPCFSKCSYCLLFHAEPAHSHLNSLARMVPVFLATYVKVQEQPCWFPFFDLFFGILSLFLSLSVLLSHFILPSVEVNVCDLNEMTFDSSMMFCAKRFQRPGLNF